MSRPEKFFLALARIAFGTLFFQAGLEKILNPEWSAAKYLAGAKTFPEFYAWLADPSRIEIVNIVNKWALLALGTSLILGFGVRLSSFLGGVLMLLYYFPVLQGFRVAHGYIVDEHVVYILILWYFATIRAGRIFGIDATWSSSRSRRVARLKKFFG